MEVNDHERAHRNGNDMGRSKGKKKNKRNLCLPKVKLFNDNDVDKESIQYNTLHTEPMGLWYTDPFKSLKNSLNFNF
ncbi:hypothetical protein BpHYR1_045636 [Brachionus plicatilis]|uniref:Uncharacterized protein n=1 Tax=Brachionus plicatilis TaxID=10195 RepID=A0A3M7QHW0_BRAPC|nr:hypothetical protein BpHYR1_045636 [Brachionus plicatilis]